MTTGATRVYIGRLARDARERDVEKLFRGYGTIKEIKLMNGFGFVEFRDHRDADDVVYSFNGKSFMGEKGERRRRERDDRRGDRDDRRDRDRDRDDRRRDDRGDRDRGRFAPPQRNPHYRLIVENLSSSCSWQDLKDLMRKAGEVTFADYMKNAIKKLDDTELKGKHIILREAPDNDVDRERRRNSRSRSKSPHRRRSLSHSPPRRRRSSSRSKSPVSNGKDNGSRSPSPHLRNEESPKRSSEPPHEEEDK
nr:7489_t:CDS:2 [Entrophospora candida]